MLEIPLNFNLDTDYQYNKFSQTMSKKRINFDLSKKDSIVAFNLNIVLLLVEIDFISKK